MRLLVVTLLFFGSLLHFACSRKNRNMWTALHKDVYYRLLAFNGRKNKPEAKHVWLSATFSNQRDSVFWDSFGNLNDRMVVTADSASPHPLEVFASEGAEGDSVWLKINTPLFF